jgi:hypothetical protein
MVAASNAIVPGEHPVMGWGAVWAGWFLATGVAALLYAFGLAVGFSGFNPGSPEIVAKGVSGGAIAWMILTWAASLWLGGMFATWFDGRNDTEMGVIRGLAVWGVSVTATVLLVASGMTHLTFTAAAIPTTEGIPTVIDPAALAQYTARIMWTAFGCALASLVTAAFGGWLGAHHVHRVYHLRTYTPHAAVRR